MPASLLWERIPHSPGFSPGAAELRSRCVRAVPAPALGSRGCSCTAWVRNEQALPGSGSSGFTDSLWLMLPSFFLHPVFKSCWTRRCPCSWQGAGLDDLYRCLPIQTILSSLSQILAEEVASTNLAPVVSHDVECCLIQLSSKEHSVF